MNLKIDFDELNEVSAQVTVQASEFAKTLKTIKTENANLKSHWKGADADKYLKAIEQQSKTMDQLQKSLESIGTFLKNVSTAYKKVSDTNQQNITLK